MSLSRTHHYIKNLERENWKKIHNFPFEFLCRIKIVWLKILARHKKERKYILYGKDPWFCRFTKNVENYFFKIELKGNKLCYIFAHIKDTMEWIQKIWKNILKMVVNWQDLIGKQFYYIYLVIWGLKCEICGKIFFHIFNNCFCL